MELQQTPPTPREFINDLVQRYVKEDPLNPFMSRTEEAKKQLLLQAMADTYGKEHPICQFLQAYALIERHSFPVEISEWDLVQISFQMEEMRHAWEVLEQDITETFNRLEQ